jgi:uncharacterized protein (TIGR02246 family)
MGDREAIRQLKARYFRLMDEKQWDAWRELFTEDAVVEASPDPNERFVGADEIVTRVRGYLENAVTVHHGHMPEIEIDGDTASGIWAMDDYVELPELVMRGAGHYHDAYVRRDGVWRIRESRLTRLRMEIRRKDAPSD